jgi:hypothetical protein
MLLEMAVDAALLAVVLDMTGDEDNALRGALEGLTSDGCEKWDLRKVRRRPGTWCQLKIWRSQTAAVTYEKVLVLGVPAKEEGHCEASGRMLGWCSDRRWGSRERRFAGSELPISRVVALAETHNQRLLLGRNEKEAVQGGVREGRSGDARCLPGGRAKHVWHGFRHERPVLPAACRMGQ